MAGVATESSLQTSGLNFTSYGCVDLQLMLSAFRSAYFTDFGDVNWLWTLYAQQRLQSEGWTVVSLPITPQLVLASPLPCSHHKITAHPSLSMLCHAGMLCHYKSHGGSVSSTLCSGSWEINWRQALHTTSHCRHAPSQSYGLWRQLICTRHSALACFIQLFACYAGAQFCQAVLHYIRAKPVAVCNE